MLCNGAPCVVCPLMPALAVFMGIPPVFLFIGVLGILRGGVGGVGCFVGFARKFLIFLQSCACCVSRAVVALACSAWAWLAASCAWSLVS